MPLKGVMPYALAFPANEVCSHKIVCPMGEYALSEYMPYMRVDCSKVGRHAGRAVVWTTSRRCDLAVVYCPSPPLETPLHPHHSAAFLYGSAYAERLGVSKCDLVHYPILQNIFK